MNFVRKSLIAAAAALAMTAATGEAHAAADPTDPIAICHSTTDGGTEADTCVGNPAANGGDAGPGVIVRPEFCLGIGFISCGDD